MSNVLNPLFEQDSRLSIYHFISGTPADRIEKSYLYQPKK
ncbi:conserved domain protein [Bacteroides fluxus YIT 12057]|uniref:Conserved domain protein n=1 Tax=Bacteroides fluxus YIT 12057 TaxID=763034 RepID=F3PWX8_9BACE|nr:conserved domain protein [Bacteroides fluxus YIT 12057]